MLSEFAVKYLSQDDIEKLFTGWLVQAETKAVEAWVNHNLRSGDLVLAAVWQQARDNLAWIEAEKKRLLGATK